ncbi:MAG: MFS transporter [Coxiella sp. RIFCSPHIGHO2_12_FULL_42_15]|nr:MAG: MFS transporter [Coxiella sp. RIFCSPHIGHO2_12_FULL_42_15]
MQKGPSASHSDSMSFFVVLIACIAAVAGILFGFDTGVISGAILFIKQDFAPSNALYSLIMASVLVGALIGSGVSGRFADFFGRRTLLIITALIFIIGTLASALAHNAWSLIAARIVVGVAIGIASFTAPLYISEIAPARFRGALVSLNQLAITIGILCSYAVDMHFADVGNWRWMFGVGVVPALLLLLGMLILPRSPRWVALKGDISQARQILQLIRHNENVELELQEIQARVTGKVSWRLLFQRWLFPVLGVGLGLAFFQQCTGINTIIYFAPTIFQMAGYDTAAGAISTTAIVGVANVVFTIIALPLIDLWGRRPLLLLGLAGMALGLLLLSLAFHFGTGALLLRWLTLLSMIIYIACFAMSLGPMMWLVISEIFPLQIRGLGSSLAVSVCWLFNGIVTFSFRYLLDTLGTAGTFCTYAIVCLLGWVFVKRFLPETKGVSLESIENNLRLGKRSRDLGVISDHETQPVGEWV